MAFIERTTLPNGLRVIAAPMRGTNTATVLIMVGTGSKYETKDINGLSHFLEHMAFKGTEKRPTTQQIAEELDRIGAESNAFTGDEYTGFYAKVAYNFLDVALEVISDILLNPLLAQEEVDRERNVILEEVRMIRDDPQRHIHDLFQNLLYGDQPAGWDVIGTPEVLAALNREHFVAYRAAHYAARNVSVVVAGNVTPAEVFTKVQRMFEEFSDGDARAKLPVRESQSEPAVLIHHKETDQVHLDIGVRGYHVSHPDRHAQQLLSVLLGAGMSSRLFLAVRERQGLAYRVRSYSIESTDTGYVVTYAGTDPTRVERTIETIIREYRRIREEAVPEAEMRKAKDFARGHFLMDLESSDEMAGFVATQETLLKKVESPEEVLAKLEAVTADDVNRIAREVFTPAKLNLALIGPYPPSEQERFAQLLTL
ncbi:insulinase family protein [Candidatus Parcubacteria bacterium]|nr:insulinase family protein [Candidatus Parcubacteria bacterium]